jgi:type III secretion protein Q
VPRSEAAATRAAARTLAALPDSWQVELPPLGGATLTVVGIDSAPSEAIVLAAARGRARGRVGLTQPVAARLVDAALGGRGTFAAVRTLGPAERGVLVALLAPVLDAIGWSLDLAPAPASAFGPSIAISLQGPLGAGVLWLDLPPMATEAGAAPWWRRASALAVEARVEIAATALPAADLTRLACGDALVFDGYTFRALAAEADWAAALVIGASRAPLRIDRGGAVALAGDFQLTAAPDRPKVDLGKEGSMDVSGPTEMATAALAAAPIEIVAELAQFTLRGDEVLALAPGVVLQVTVDRRRAILLRAGGEIWAEGELCDVDGELGVRVTRLLRR